MLLATQLAPEIPMKRTSHDPAPARFTWTALPVQLNLRPNACRSVVYVSGRFSMPCPDTPVTTASARTAPFAHRGCGADDF